MKRLVIVATRFNNNEEGRKIFEERNWRPARDQSTIPAKKKLVGKKSHSTPLIDLTWEEWEYE